MAKSQFRQLIIARPPVAGLVTRADSLQDIASGVLIQRSVGLGEGCGLGEKSDTPTGCTAEAVGGQGCVSDCLSQCDFLPPNQKSLHVVSLPGGPDSGFLREVVSWHRQGLLSFLWT